MKINKKNFQASENNNDIPHLCGTVKPYKGNSPIDNNSPYC